MKKTPNIVLYEKVARDPGVLAHIGNSWVPARPMGYWSFKYRCKCAWLVFTGRADALVWPLGQ